MEASRIFGRRKSRPRGYAGRGGGCRRSGSEELDRQERGPVARTGHRVASPDVATPSVDVETSLPVQRSPHVATSAQVAIPLLHVAIPSANVETSLHVERSPDVVTPSLHVVMSLSTCGDLSTCSDLSRCSDPLFTCSDPLSTCREGRFRPIITMLCG